MASLLESNSSVVGRKIEKRSVGICDSWFYRERPSHGEVVTHEETCGRIGNHRKEQAASVHRKWAALARPAGK